MNARHPLSVNRGWSPTADQQLFWDCYQARLATGICPDWCGRSGCASANPAGKSLHEAVPGGAAAALAVDMDPIDGDVATFHAVCAEEGLHFPLDAEPWHAQPVEVVPTYWDPGFVPAGW